MSCTSESFLPKLFFFGLIVFFLVRDACNRKSNQQNLGTIRGSNLCTEIIEYTSPDEVAVCNLASVALNKFVRNDSFDFQALLVTVHEIVHNLNRVIDGNYYPVPEAERSNRRHRPIGIGVQGLADTFFLLRFPYDSPQAAELNRNIFETIYYAACWASNDLAKRDGPYETFAGSPASKGQLQFDLWNDSQHDLMWPWQPLKESIIKHGLRNSLLVAPMPTASTAQILGNTESFEPVSSNIYSRSTLAGTFTVINHHLVHDLVAIGMWNEDMKNAIVARGGSIQDIESIPIQLRNIYKTVWEIKQRVILDMAADRGRFIDQSQSMNVHMAEPTFAKLTSLHFHGWRIGLKTGMYYLRSRPAADAIQFTVEKKKVTPVEGEVCTMQDGCLSCGS